MPQKQVLRACGAQHDKRGRSREKEEKGRENDDGF
jgi:hypothetical protein